MKNLKLNSLILISIFILINKMSFAQLSFEWAKSYSDLGARSQSASDVVIDTLGNIYITGMNSNGYSVNDMVTLKYNSSGQYQWGKTYNFSSEYTGEFGKSLAVYRNGTKTYIYAAGEVNYIGLTQFIKIIKYDEYGNTKWEKQYDPGVPSESDQLTKIMTDASGSCYVTGATQTKTFIAKYDSSGTLIYNIVRDAPVGYAYMIISDAAIDASRNIYITGNCDSSGTKHIYNVKVDSAGIFKWQKLFKTVTPGYQSSGRSISIGKSGKIYLTGEYYSSATFHDYITLKLDQTTGDTIWTRKYNALNTTDLGKKIALDANDNVYVSGTSYIGSYENVHTLKYDSNGVQNWVRIYNGPGGYSDVVNDISCDNSGNVYLTGASDNSYFGSYLTMKYNSNGDMLWNKVFDTEAGAFEAATALAIDKSGNIIITGNAGNSGTDIATIKYNSSGAQQWLKKYYGAEITEDVSNQIITDKKGYIYQIGKARTNQFGDNIQIIKYNYEGTRKWVYNRGGTFAGYNAYDEGNSIAVDTLGNVYFTGTVFSFPGNKQDVITGKLDSNGTEQWYTVRSGLDGNDFGNDIALDSARNVYVSGVSASISGDQNLILIKYNNSGVEQWVRAYGVVGRNDVPNAMTIDRFGNIFVTGTSSDTSGESEIVTIKYSNVGVQQWVKIYNGTAAGADNGNCIVNDIFGNVYIGGSANNTTTGSDFLMLKYKNDVGGTLEFVRTASRKDGDCKEEITAMLIDTSHFADPDSTEFNVHFAGNTCKLNSDQINAVKGMYISGISYLTGATDEYAIPGSIESKTYGLAIDSRPFLDRKAIYMTGTTTDNSGNTDIFVKKYYANSPHISNTNIYDGGIYKYDGHNGSKNNQAAIDIYDRAYIGGASFDTAQGSEMTLLKVYKEDYEFEIQLFIQGLFVLDEYNQPAMKKDTITVYLRNSTAPYSIADSAKGLINANAYGTFFFTNVTNGVNYYVAVKHRNSLETWSSSTRIFNDNYTYYYFYGFNAAFGNNQIKVGVSPADRWANFSGDVNQDGTIDASDLAMIDNDAANFNSGYISTDLNYDEFTDATDAAMADNNAANFVAAILP